MLESIVSSVVSGLIITAILEGIKKWREGPSTTTEPPTVESPPVQTGGPIPPPTPSQETSPSRTVGCLLAMVRVVGAVFVGFIGSAVLAAIMESGGHEEIKFGSPLMILLMIVCTTLTWIAMDRVSRRLRKAS